MPDYRRSTMKRYTAKDLVALGNRIHATCALSQAPYPLKGGEKQNPNCDELR